jgi:hypothetical protein
MITFKNFGYLGRLGNQLFQYAVGISLALENNCEFYLPLDILDRNWHGQNCLLDCFTLEYKTTNIPDIIYDFDEPIEYYQRFNPYFINIKSPVNLNGFFQCEKYFIKYKHYIKQLFTVKPSILNKSKEYLNSLCPDINKSKVGLHMRRGDEIEVNNANWLNDLSEKSWLSIYLDRSLNIVEEESIIIIFTGGSRNNCCNNNDDIKWCNNVLKPFLINKGYNNVVISNVNDTIIDFTCMSLCDNLILTNISSFSWWAGYLNSNKNKKIIVPKNIPYNKKDFSEYWSNEFIQV